MHSNPSPRSKDSPRKSSKQTQQLEAELEKVTRELEALKQAKPGIIASSSAGSSVDGATVIQAAQAVGQCKSQLRSVQAEFAGLKNNALGDLKVMARRITQVHNVRCVLCAQKLG